MASLSKLNRVVCACSGINIFLTYNNNIETLSRVMYIVHSKKKKSIRPLSPTFGKTLRFADNDVV